MPYSEVGVAVHNGTTWFSEHLVRPTGSDLNLGAKEKADERRLAICFLLLPCNPSSNRTCPPYPRHPQLIAFFNCSTNSQPLQNYRIQFLTTVFTLLRPIPLWMILSCSEVAVECGETLVRPIMPHGHPQETAAWQVATAASHGFDDSNVFKECKDL